MNILEALLLLVLLIVISAFVSCSELALASARKIKLQVMAKDGGDTRALDVLNMQQQPGSFITVVQIGLNAVAILAGIVGEAAVRPYFGGLLANAGSWGSTAASLLTFALVTGSFILIADLMPKRIAMTHPEAVAVRIVRPMMFLIFILKPFVWTFDGLANSIFKLFKISTVRQEQLTSEDIYAVVDAGAQAGVLKEQEHYLIENIFDMQARTVTSTMSTREYIAYFDKNDGSDTVLEMMSEKPHNKFLVCDGDLERVIGYIESHTLLTLFLKEKDVRLTDKRVLRKALFIPDTLSLYDVLETFKTSGEDFAGGRRGNAERRDEHRHGRAGQYRRRAANHPPHRRYLAGGRRDPARRRHACAGHRGISQLGKLRNYRRLYDVFPAQNPETHRFFGLRGL